MQIANNCSFNNSDTSISWATWLRDLHKASVQDEFQFCPTFLPLILDDILISSLITEEFLLY